MPKSGKIIAEFNGEKFEHTLGELLQGSRSHFMVSWLSEAILFKRAMPESCYQIEHLWKIQILNVIRIIIMSKYVNVISSGRGVRQYG